MKKLMTENMTVEDFNAAMEKTFPNLPGDDKLAELAKVPINNL